MKKHNIVEFILVGLLVCTAISCKSSSNADEKSAVNCPTATLPLGELMGGSSRRNQEMKKYEGCTVSVKAELKDVKAKEVELCDTNGYTGCITCEGNFSSDTFRDIGYELQRLKEKQLNDKLPVATFTAKLVDKSFNDFVLTDCRMTNYGK